MSFLRSVSLKILRGINPKVSCVSFSGGKDSLVVLDLAYQAGINQAVFCNTSVNYDETVLYVKKIRNIYNIDFKVLNPTKNFFKLVEDLGFPSRRLRWCCEALKFAPLAKFVKEEKIEYLITGIRHEESFKRKSYPQIDENPYIPAKRVNPIINWTNDDVWNYIRKYSLYNNPLYDQGFQRVGCWTCPFHTKEDWNIIQKFSPKKIEFLKAKLTETFSSQIGVGLNDLNDFIDDYAWTKHIFSPSAEIYGKIHYGEDGLIIIEINSKNKLDSIRINNIISIVADQFEFSNNRWKINTEVPQNSLRILIEKALNCVGCGVCSILCPKNALFLDKKGFIKVNQEKCNHCLSCLKTNLLKGACLGRNYSPLRKHVELLDRKDDTESHDFEISELCSGVKLGFIRTRTDFEKIIQNAFRLGKVSRIRSDIFRVGSLNYTAFIAKRNGYTELKVKTYHQDIVSILQNIRKIILNIRDQNVIDTN